MLPRNLTLFRFPASLTPTLQRLDEHLPDAALKPVGPLELSSRGFVTPFGRGDDALSCWVGQCVLLTLGAEDKVLPSAAVNEALAQKLDAVREREGRSPGGRERKRLKDEVLTDLLPRALVRPSRVNAWLDLGLGWLAVDTASRKTGEAVGAALREALGSFPALPVNAESAPRAILTGWLMGEAMPDGFVLGDACELRDPVDSGAVVKASRQELDSDEIAEHLKAGKQCFRLALTFDERLAFELGEDLTIRKLQFLDAAREALDREADQRDSLRAEVEAQFALANAEIARLLTTLDEAFQLSKAED